MNSDNQCGQRPFVCLPQITRPEQIAASALGRPSTDARIANLLLEGRDRSPRNGTVLATSLL
jgi:hypothetical protein